MLNVHKKGLLSQTWEEHHESAQGFPIVWVFRMPGIIQAVQIERDQPGGCHHQGQSQI
jgi:hypothetical protein